MFWTAEKPSPWAAEPTSCRTEAVSWHPGLRRSGPGRVFSRSILLQLLISLTTSFHFCWPCCFLSAVDLLVGSWATFCCLNCNILLSFITFGLRKWLCLQFFRGYGSQVSINVCTWGRWACIVKILFKWHIDKTFKNIYILSDSGEEGEFKLFNIQGFVE